MIVQGECDALYFFFHRSIKREREGERERRSRDAVTMH